VKTIRAAMLFAGLVAAGSVMAHQDRVLPIAADGTMADIPAEFGRAKLEIKFTDPNKDEPPVTSVVLSLGDKQTHLPVCVTGLLLSRDMKDVYASGSWYRDQSLPRGLPYYINVDFYDHSNVKHDWNSPKFSLLFNLQTSKLMEMHVYVKRQKVAGIQRIPVDVSKLCWHDSLKEFWQSRP
jgi:hypothetical protein